MKQDELKKILEDHADWLEDETKGKRADFSTGDWRAADLHGANLRKAFISVRAGTTELYDKIANEYVDPEEMTGDLWNTYRSELQGADLSNADLQGAILQGADLSGADLSGANLNEAELGIFFADAVDEYEGNTESINPIFYTDLSGADISSANLRNADLTRAKLAGADLSNADLTGAKLFSAKLEDAVLAGAKLVGADLSPRTYTDFEASMYAECEGYNDDGEREDFPTNLKNADLSNANLRGANLRKVNFTDAVLTNANLAGADLTDAKLTNADLTGANLRGVKGYTPKKESVKQTLRRTTKIERGTT